MSLSKFNKIKQAMLGEYVTDADGLVVGKTYAELDEMRRANALGAGVMYIIRDHQTIHKINNTTPAAINYGVEEPIIVQAISPNQFGKIVHSQTYPNDMIYYDFGDNVCEDGITPRKGRIVYRKDTVNSIEAYYDWRNVKFRRWAISGATWSSGTTYATNALVSYSNSLWLALSGSTGVTPVAGNTWMLYWDYNTYAAYSLPSKYISPVPTGFSCGNIAVPTDATDYNDYWTFSVYANSAATTSLNAHRSPAIYGISIDRAGGMNYNNIVFCDSHEVGLAGRANTNRFAADCKDMLFGANVVQSTVGPFSSNNIIRASAQQNNFGGWFMNNISSSWVSENNCSDDFRGNIFAAPFYGNTAVNACYNNKFKALFQNNTLAMKYSYRNTYNYTEWCDFVARVSDCNFLGTMSYVTINTWTTGKIITGNTSQVVINKKSPLGKQFYDIVAEDGTTIPTLWT